MILCHNLRNSIFLFLNKNPFKSVQMNRRQVCTNNTCHFTHILTFAKGNQLIRMTQVRFWGMFYVILDALLVALFYLLIPQLLLHSGEKGQRNFNILCVSSLLTRSILDLSVTDRFFDTVFMVLLPNNRITKHKTKYRLIFFNRLYLSNFV